MASLGPVAIAQSDTVDLAVPCRTIACDVAGTIAVLFGNGLTDQFDVDPADDTNVIPWKDMKIVRVLDTGTTLTDGQMHGEPW